MLRNYIPTKREEIIYWSSYVKWVLGVDEGDSLWDISYIVILVHMEMLNKRTTICDNVYRFPFIWKFFWVIWWNKRIGGLITSRTWCIRHSFDRLLSVLFLTTISQAKCSFPGRANSKLIAHFHRPIFIPNIIPIISLLWKMVTWEEDNRNIIIKGIQENPFDCNNWSLARVAINQFTYN